MKFFIDDIRNIVVTYEELVSIVASKKTIKKYIKYDSVHDILIELVSAMYFGVDVTLLDNDFSNNELALFGINATNLCNEYKLSKKTEDIENINDFLRQIKRNASNVNICIFTSGTTGRPKKISHNLEFLIKKIVINNNHTDDVWGLAYNITHFAGVQVFLQALFNLNCIVNVFGENKLNANALLEKYKCTNISATATYYKNFLFCDINPNENIKNITFGGEKVTEGILKLARKKFPNSKVHNVYASTEFGSLLVGNGEYFTIPENLKDRVRISENGHLMVNKSVLINGVGQEWVDTNDIVELNDNGSFKFLSRESDFINVGGYKVNVQEIEDVIVSLPEIMDAIVYGRDNSVTGKLVVADIKLMPGYSEVEVKKTLLKVLKNNLQSFKIPRVINVVSELKENRSGKKVRK